MTFEEVLPALRAGKKIRRKDKCWQDIFGYVFYNNEKMGLLYSEPNAKEYFRYDFDETDLFSNDWEIVEEKKKVKLRDLTPRQYGNWYENYCCEHCEGCAFDRVNCDSYNQRICWVNNKDLYSDKFLDQEIEIEV